MLAFGPLFLHTDLEHPGCPLTESPGCPKDIYIDIHYIYIYIYIHTYIYIYIYIYILFFNSEVTEPWGLYITEIWVGL